MNVKLRKVDSGFYIEATNSNYLNGVKIVTSVVSGKLNNEHQLMGVMERLGVTSEDVFDALYAMDEDELNTAIFGGATGGLVFCSYEGALH